MKGLSRCGWPYILWLELLCQRYFFSTGSLIVLILKGFKSFKKDLFLQVRPSLDACQAGCQFFGRIDARNGVHDTLGNLQSCNQSKLITFRIFSVIDIVQPQVATSDLREPSCQLVSLAADSTLTAMSPLNATCSNSPDRGPLPLLPYSPGVPLPHPPPSPGLVAQRL